MRKLLSMLLALALLVGVTSVSLAEEAAAFTGTLFIQKSVNGRTDFGEIVKGDAVTLTVFVSNANLG